MKKFVLLAIAASLVFAWGCAKKAKVEPEPAKVEAPAPAPEPVATRSMPLSPHQVYEQEYAGLPASHTVKKGECLWWIAEYKQIYNDPFMWPLIYKANRAKIKKSPNLIYPKQVFDVPRSFDLTEVKAARKKAGAPWKKLEPGPNAKIPAQVRAELGYGF